MADGSNRINVLETSPGKWMFRYGIMTAAEFAILKALNDLGEALHYMNEWESPDWKWVFITAFDPEVLIDISGPSAVFWSLSITLEEVPA